MVGPTWKDDRRFHLVTRGNVDGIISAAFFLAKIPDLRVSFVTSNSAAIDAMRRDRVSSELFIVDLGLTDRLLRHVNRRAKGGTRIHLLDHHQQTETTTQRFAPGVNVVTQQGVSAASVAYEYLGLDDAHTHLAALADLVEYCSSPWLEKARAEHGQERLQEEARTLDYAWRLLVDDDHFRIHAARRLATGAWPSQVGEIQRRYLQIVNEGRWERALEKVRHRLVVRDGLGLLRFGRYRSSLFGFGTRALSHVAQEQGCRVALLLNSRKNRTSLSLRGVGPDYVQPRPAFNLGSFVQDFTRSNGITGGGHPSSAGAKIHTRHVPLFVEQVYALA